MPLVVVPVRYPLTTDSKRTLREAIRIADERDAALTVLHIDLYQDSHNVARVDLKRSVEQEFGSIDNARYVVRKGFLVEESILEEVAAENADVVVIGSRQAGRWRRTLRKIFSDPDIDSFLRDALECTVVTVGS